MTPGLAFAVVVAAILTVLLGAALIGALLGRSPQHDAGDGRDGERAEGGTSFHTSSDSGGAQHDHA